MAPTGAADQRVAELVRMKRLATSLLVIAAVIFAIALRLESSVAWAGFVRAAAEGAMVGALADWFAVTALFRRPLGLPIPHTAIIPSRKDSIGESIGHFVQEHFLTIEVVTDRLRAIGAAGQLGRWLADPEVADRLARILAGGLTGLLRIIGDSDIQTLVERSIRARVAATPVAPTAGRILGAVLVGQRRRDLLYALVQIVAQLLQENQDAIRKKITEGTPWWMPRGVDRTIYTRLIETVTATLVELGRDPNHPLHAQFDAQVERFVARLQNDPELIAAGENYKTELANHPILRDLAGSLWRDARSALEEQGALDDPAIRETLVRGVIRLGEVLQADPALAAKVDGWVEGVARYAIREYGDEVSELIAQTVKRWDAETTVQRIELQVGRDLQFIRINGTVVGGLAGLAIYAVALLLR